MEISKKIDKMIILEFVALLFLVGCIVYALFAIKKSDTNKVSSQDGMVMVLDDSRKEKMKKLSDGQGLELDGITYTITNNNSYDVIYKIVVDPNIHDSNVLEQIRISTDDRYIEDLTDLDRTNGGYVIAEYELKSGFTKIHLVKNWFKLDAPDSVLKNNVDFEFKLVVDNQGNK